MFVLQRRDTWRVVMVCVHMLHVQVCVGGVGGCRCGGVGGSCGGGEGVFVLCARLCSGHVQVLVYCVVVMPLQCLCTQCSLCEGEVFLSLIVI